MWSLVIDGNNNLYCSACMKPVAVEDVHPRALREIHFRKEKKRKQ
jgi:hypothetical protein